MNSEPVFQELCRIGILPVVRSEGRSDALRAVEALAEGGIPVAEITMTVPGGLDVIRDLVRGNGHEWIVGAGTVTDPDTCAAAIDAGSRFVVTPVFCPEVIDLCRENGVCVIGGALTPTEIHATFRRGADAVKVFPVKAVGGPAYLRMLREPMPDIPLVPTGGVALETVADYLAAGAALVGAGGDLVRRDADGRPDPGRITARARGYVSAIAEARR